MTGFMVIKLVSGFIGNDEEVFQRYLREYEQFQVWYFSGEYAAAREEALSSGHFIDRESETYKRFVDRIYISLVHKEWNQNLNLSG